MWAGLRLDASHLWFRPEVTGRAAQHGSTLTFINGTNVMLKDTTMINDAAHRGPAHWAQTPPTHPTHDHLKVTNSAGGTTRAIYRMAGSPRL